MTSDLFKNNTSFKSYKRSFEKGVSDVMNFVGANPKQDVKLLSVRSTVQSSKIEIQKIKKPQVSFSVNNKTNNGQIAIALYEYMARKYFKILVTLNWFPHIYSLHVCLPCSGDDEELSFKKGDIITQITKVNVGFILILIHSYILIIWLNLYRTSQDGG